MASVLRIALLMLAIGALGLAAAPAVIAAGDDSFTTQIASLLRDLDSPRFAVREFASKRLEALSKHTEQGRLLAAQLQQALLANDVSLEVAARVQRLLRGLPRTPPAKGLAISGEQIERLIDGLDADRFATRDAARRRLAHIARDESQVCVLLTRLKHTLANPNLGLNARQAASLIYEQARGVWLLSDPRGWKLPPVSDARIAGWIAGLASDADDQGAHCARRAAERELLDLLARGDYVDRVKDALQTRLKAGAISSRAAKRMRTVLDWTKPGLVAEVWQQGHLVTVQYLLVDVPQRPELAAGVTHFDRVSETVAHCVIGNSLSPGDYPIGQAIAHPTQPDILFQLVNTPTPRRRMAYPYTMRQSESQRLRAITRRTMQGCIAGRRYLSDLDILLLKELDAEIVSRKIGEYFLAVDDRPSETPGRYALGGRLASHHGKVCYVLAGIARPEAIRGIVKAIEARRFLPPAAGDAPYALPWMACLAIASRTPGEAMNRWLQQQTRNQQPLFVGPGEDKSDTPTLGATAAAMLLKRIGVIPSQMGLVKLKHNLLDNAGCPGYRYESPEAQRRLLEWWKSRRDIGESPVPAP